MAKWAFLNILIAGLAALLSASVRAQTPCGVVDILNYPVDTTVFKIAQDFAAPNERHEGRFHTGEDWYGGRGRSYGQPVRAIAAGRVTYGYKLGWGAEGGVVIIEHTFPDGSIAYSQYGHLEETDTVTLPTKFSCVQAGQVIGVIGSPRPAPHVHFEIRINQPDIPGPGYTWEDPAVLGYRHPAKFITNWQAWLLPSHRWHVETRAETGLSAPPLVLDDNSLMYLDGGTLKRATSDGRVLWRMILEKPAVGITGYQRSPLLTYADGTMQRVSYEGGFTENWTTGVALDSPPIIAGDALVFHTPDNALAAFDSVRREVVWRLDGIPPFVRYEVAQEVIGVITADHEILTISRAGHVVNRAQLRGMAAMAAGKDGALLVYSQGGAWTVSADGTWSLAIPDAPPGGESSALFVNTEGQAYLFDGAKIYSYSAEGALLWEADLPGVSGLTELAQYGGVLLLTSARGDIVALREGGGICNRTRIYGDNRALMWHTLGNDGVLRAAAGDQILGLDWAKFIGGCG